VAFADPQSVTVNAVAQSLPRTGISANSGTFQKDDGTYRLTVTQNNGKRNRRTVRLDNQKIAADPFQTGLNDSYSMSVYLTVDTPITGYSIAEQKLIVDGLVAYLQGSSGARVTQLLGGEL